MAGRLHASAVDWPSDAPIDVGDPGGGAHSSSGAPRTASARAPRRRMVERWTNCRGAPPARAPPVPATQTGTDNRYWNGSVLRTGTVA